MLIMSSDVRKGLEGVIVDETAIAKTDVHSLTYRGYPVQELAQHCSFEEVAYLIWNGDLPTTEQLEAFKQEEIEQREISEPLISVIRSFPPTAHPMDALRTAVSHLGMEAPDVMDNSPEANRNKAVRLLAQIPTIAAADYRYRQGLERIPPSAELSFSANFFNMCFGQIPSQEVLDCFEVAFISYAEHGFNSSTFTARIVASTLSDMYSAVTAAIGSLKGSLHGGANAGVMRMLLEIGKPELAQSWVDSALAAKRKVMGFGHRVYKRGDPRVPIMHAALNEMVRSTGDHQWLDIQEIVTRTMWERRRMYPNIDYEAGPTYYLMGFDIDIFGPLFVMSRLVGLTTHFTEQMAFNRMIRPISSYVGPTQRALTDRTKSRTLNVL